MMYNQNLYKKNVKHHWSLVYKHALDKYTIYSIFVRISLIVFGLSSSCTVSQKINKLRVGTAESLAALRLWDPVLLFQWSLCNFLKRIMYHRNQDRLLQFLLSSGRFCSKLSIIQNQMTDTDPLTKLPILIR
jgi:hypothetical protein